MGIEVEAVSRLVLLREGGAIRLFVRHLPQRSMLELSAVYAACGDAPSFALPALPTASPLPSSERSS